MIKNKNILIAYTIATLIPFNISAKDANYDYHEPVANSIITEQRVSLEKNTKGAGFGPQSPRDIDNIDIGNNQRLFGIAPSYTEMNLCHIHFHKNAEHKGGEFTKYAGNGDGHGFQSGFIYSYLAKLNSAELKPVAHEVCPSKHGGLVSGDTIEAHYVYSTAKISPGPGLSYCFNDSIKNPQLRVESQVYILVNDKNALDFKNLAKYNKVYGLYQATNIPSNTGTPVEYIGSTTGPDYNTKGSPFQVSWSVRPNVAKVDITSVNAWCKKNVFNEDHAHGVRNLIINPDLLSKINK